MASYLIKKDKKNNQIVYLEYDLHGYKFNPKKSNKEKSYIEVNEVTIYDHSMIDSILTTKFNHTFKKLMAMAKIILSDDDASEDETRMCLDQIELVRQIIFGKYEDFLNKEKERLFLEKLRAVENELRIKQMLIKEKAMYLEEEEEKRIGRGR